MTNDCIINVTFSLFPSKISNELILLAVLK